MEHGFIHDKLDIKILILFILGRMSEPIDLDTLTELTFLDGGIGYFDFTDCITELIETNHIKKENDLFFITEKGLRNGHTTESSLPYSVRRKAERSTEALVQIQRRNAMIIAEHTERIGGGQTVTLALSDGLGEILRMKLFAATEAQATTMKNTFNKRAEQLHGQIIELLMDDQA